MPSVGITSYVAFSDPPGSKIRIDGTWSGVSSIRIVIWCHDDHGERLTVSIPGAGDPPIVLNGDGTFSVTVDTLCGCGQEAASIIVGLDAQGNEITSQSYPGGPLACTDLDCCPKAADMAVTAKFIPQCTADCRRLTSLDITYQAKLDPACPSVGLISVTIRDPAGTDVHSWPPAWFMLAGPLQYLTIPAYPLLPGQGYQAVIGVYATMAGKPLTCAEIVKPFDVPPCEHPPVCPTGLSLAVFDIGCTADPLFGCLPTAQFVIGGTFDTGCGSGAATVLALDFGDGSPAAAIPVPTKGTQQLVVAHRYITGGWKNATLSVAHPTGCSPATVAAAVKLGDCVAADCVDCPPPPKPPAWCLCKSCWLFTRKPGKGWCKPLLALFIPFLATAIFGFLHGFLFAPTTQPLWVTVTFLIASLGSAFYLTAYSDWCGNCCAACAIWPAIFLGILLSLLAWYGGTPPLNGPLVWVFVLIGVVMTGAYLSWSYGAKCKKEEKDQLGPDDWCKDAL